MLKIQQKAISCLCVELDTLFDQGRILIKKTIQSRHKIFKDYSYFETEVCLFEKNSQKYRRKCDGNMEPSEMYSKNLEKVPSLKK